MTEKEITLLVEAGIGYIHLEYMGGGDSGAIENITYISNSCQKMQDSFDTDSLSLDINDYECLNRPNKVSEQLIEDMAYKHLNNIEDWWNNEGGYGALVIEIPSLKFRNMNIIEYRETETYNHEGFFETQEL